MKAALGLAKKIIRPAASPASHVSKYQYLKVQKTYNHSLVAPETSPSYHFPQHQHEHSQA